MFDEAKYLKARYAMEAMRECAAREHSRALALLKKMDQSEECIHKCHECPNLPKCEGYQQIIQDMSQFTWFTQRYKSILLGYQDCHVPQLEKKEPLKIWTYRTCYIMDKNDLNMAEPDVENCVEMVEAVKVYGHDGDEDHVLIGAPMLDHLDCGLDPKDMMIIEQIYPPEPGERAKTQWMYTLNIDESAPSFWAFKCIGSWE